MRQMDPTTVAPPNAPRGELPEAWSRALHDLYRWARDEGIPVSGRAAAAAPAAAGLRRCPRIPMNFPIRFRLSAESQSFDGVVCDVGFGGLRIESADCPAVLQQGAKLACAFHFEIDVDQRVPIGFRGEVAWVEPAADAQAGCAFGVTIVEATPTHACLFDDLVRHGLQRQQQQPTLVVIG